MGFLNKVKAVLVEDVGNTLEFDTVVLEEIEDEKQSLPNIQTNTVTEIYYKNNLEDKSRSIFKVEELIDSLPKEMATDTKKASVSSILNGFGIPVGEVIEDGIQRANLLTSYRKKILEEGDVDVEQKELEIENHKKEIEELEKDIVAKKEEMNMAEKLINDETERILKLIEFIEEDEE